MKTSEEIKQLAANLANPNVCKTTNWIEGYTQCQEDMQKEIEYWQGEYDHWHKQAMEMANKKYTEEHILFAFVHGGTKFEENKDASILNKNFKELISSLNKQD